MATVCATVSCLQMSVETRNWVDTRYFSLPGQLHELLEYVVIKFPHCTLLPVSQGCVARHCPDLDPHGHVCAVSINWTCTPFAAPAHIWPLGCGVRVC